VVDLEVVRQDLSGAADVRPGAVPYVQVTLHRRGALNA
jgi:hypothetical protein